MKDAVEAEVLREFARKCPKLNAAVSKRRYLLPKVREGDYANQEFCDTHFKRVIMGWAIGEVRDRDSAAVETLNIISALKYDRPLLYLERELGEKFVETDLPEDLTTEEVHWPWPSFRVMLPKGLVGAPSFDGKPMHGLYLDLTLWAEGEAIFLAREYAIELNQLFGKRAGSVEELTTPSTQLYATGFYLSSLTDYIKPGFQPDVASCMASWSNWKLRDMIASTGDVLGGGPREEINIRFLEKVRALAFNILLFLSQEPLAVLNEAWVRKPKTEGKHLVSGLLDARFVGDCMPKFRVNPPMERKEYEPSGRTTAPHWVRGYWKRIVYGKGRALRKRQWIMPYCTGLSGESGEMKKGE
jgi:hypothetical protein